MKPLTHKCGTVYRAAFSKHVDGGLPEKITYHHPAAMRLPGMTREQTRLAFQTIFRVAQLYVPVPFAKVSRKHKAMLRISMGPKSEFDREGNILAMAEVLNLRDPAPRELWFSPFVNWSDGPITEDAINPIPVGAHEVGHALGFGHNDNLGLMSPTINRYICTPTEGEMSIFNDEYPEWNLTE